MLERQLINGIEVYTVSALAQKTYRENAKHGKNISLTVLERKLTGLIMNCYEKKHVFEDKYMCRIGSFKMIVNETTKMVEVILWDTESHSCHGLTRDKFQGLMEVYQKLGLSKNGDKIINSSLQ